MYGPLTMTLVSSCACKMSRINKAPVCEPGKQSLPKTSRTEEHKTLQPAAPIHWLGKRQQSAGEGWVPRETFRLWEVSTRGWPRLSIDKDHWGKIPLENQHKITLEKYEVSGKQGSQQQQNPTQLLDCWENDAVPHNNGPCRRAVSKSRHEFYLPQSPPSCA